MLNIKSPDSIETLRPNDRTIMSNDDIIIPRSTPSQSPSALKPAGLWYAFGTEWIDWCRGEMPHWIKDNFHRLELQPDNFVLQISNLNELIRFELEFKSKHQFLTPSIMNINWEKVAKHYSGIEIYPYVHRARLTHMWYYGWDVSSGCIWDVAAIKSVTPISYQLTSKAIEQLQYRKGSVHE